MISFKSHYCTGLFTVMLAACTSEPSSHVDNPPPTDQAQAIILTPERIHTDPSLNGSSLRKPALSPDGSLVTVLRGRADNARQQDLWAYDLETESWQILVSSTDLLGAPEVLSEEEKNRRERARETGSGIISYNWVSDDLLLFPIGGDIYTYDLTAQKPRQVTATPGFETDPKVAPNGRYAAYVRGDELYVNNLETGLERQLTTGATDTLRHATASFVVQEELDRQTGYWWSPDSQSLAYTQIDESALAIENRLNFSAEGIGNIAQRYPFAGTDNVTIKLGIISRTGGDTIWADLGADPDIYLTRVLWSRNADTLYVGILSRDHKTHSVLAIDPETGASRLHFEETSPTWINVGTDFKTLSDSSLLWSSEKDGKRAVYKIAAEGTWERVTPDNLLVNDLLCMNETEQTLFVTGWQSSDELGHSPALERHVFKMNLDGSGLTRLSQKEGRYSANFSSNCARYISTFSNPDTPPQTGLYDSDGNALTVLNANILDSDHPYAPFLEAHISPEFGQIAAPDGTPLDYVLYKPLDLETGEKRPAITLVYGGPGVQRVHKGWERRHFARMLAQHGFVVFQVENRGGTNRGKAFEDPLYRAMGRAEVIDQSIGAEWLAAQPFVDPTRMGVFGWSYGGYMTLHMLAQTDHYQSGVSGAPVTDWALYDTAYTERYLGHPNADNPNYIEGAYEEGAVFAHLDGLTEPFLLIHGMADDNVVFRHSVTLMDVMQKRGAQNMRLMTYPGEKHGFRQTENQIHRDRHILEFFQETLSKVD